MVMKAHKSKICCADVPVQVQRLEAAVEPRGTSTPFWRLKRENSLFFCSSLQLTGRDPPTVRSAVCSTRATALNVSAIQKKSSPRITENNVWPTMWAPPGPVELIHTRNRHRLYDEDDKGRGWEVGQGPETTGSLAKIRVGARFWSQKKVTEWF